MISTITVYCIQYTEYSFKLFLLGVFEIEDTKKILKAGQEAGLRYIVHIIGWVNLYQKFEIEKYTVCGMERH